MAQVSPLRHVLWAFALALAIYVQSQTPGDLTYTTHTLDPFDKYAHFFVYGLLATVIYRIPKLYHWGFLGAFLSFALVTYLGFAIEIYQFFIPGRDCEIQDWYADMAGALMAILAYRFIPTYRNLLELDLAKCFKTNHIS